jgi:hypothetical protein
MDETLAFYRPTDAPSFRLFLNAAHMLMAKPLPSPAPARANGPSVKDLRERSDELHRDVKAGLGDVGGRLGANDYDDVVRGIVADLERRAAVIPALAGALQGLGGDHVIVAEWRNIATLALPELTGERTKDHKLAHRLMNIELVISLAEAWQRLAEVEHALS